MKSERQKEKQNQKNRTCKTNCRDNAGTGGGINQFYAIQRKTLENVAFVRKNCQKLKAW